MQPLNSATTGALALVTQRASAGQKLGTTGSPRSQIVSAETAQDWLLRQASPEATDAALCRSLISTLGVTAMPRTEMRFPVDGRAYPVTVGCAFDVKDHGAIPAALDKIEQALTPASPEHCEGWLVMLQAATAHRADSGATSAVAYSLYAAELRQWPADVAKAACERLARGKVGNSGTNWFPTLAELVSECERLASNRKAIYAGLKRYVREPERIAQLSEASPQQQAAVRKMAEEAKAKLRETADRMRPAAKHSAMPSTAGKPDAGGLTPQMRELMARRAAEQLQR